MDWTNILVFLLVICVIGLFLFVAFLVFTYFYAQRQIGKYLMPDPLDIQNDLDRLARTHSQLNEDQLAHLVIKETATVTAVVGFFTGLGGFVLLLIGLPFDLAFCTRRQMKMVQVITAIYGNNELNPDLLQARYMAVVGGGAGVGWVLKKVIPKLIGEAIPFVGAFAGGGINWVSTKSIGEAAIAWNKGETLRATAAGKYVALKDRVGPAAARVFGRNPEPHSLPPVYPAAPVPVSPVPVSVKTKQCPTCGANWSREQVFCGADGTLLPVQ